MYAHWLERLAARGTQTVAYNGELATSAVALLRMAGAIAAQLPDATPGSEVAFSFERDHLACVAALLATWAKGHIAAVPEDGTRETIMPLLAHPNNVAFLHDTGVGLGIHVPTLLSACEHPSAPLWQERPADQIALLAHAQPIVGDARVMGWTQAELRSELERLAQDPAVHGPQHVASCLTPTAMGSLLLGPLACLHAGTSFEAHSVAPAASRALREHQLIAAPAHRRVLEHAHFMRMPSLPLEQERPTLVTALESALLREGAVQDAAAALLPTAEVCALIVVAAAASAEAQLHALIAGHLPRQATYKLRLLPELPRDANGRLPDWRVYLAFQHGANGARLETELCWTETADSAPAQRRFRTRLPENYAFFEGHYHNYPVLAGAAQVHELAQACCKLVDPNLGGVRRLSAIKFTGRIQPHDELDVIVRPGTARGDFTFEVLRADKRCTSGRIEYFTDAGGEAS